MTSTLLRLPAQARRLAAAGTLALLACTLAACGGGSSSGTALPVLPTTPTTPPTTTTPTTPTTPDTSTKPEMRCAP